MYDIKKLWINRDKTIFKKWAELLMTNDLSVDTQVDLTIGVFDNNNLIGTASVYKNILKCVSISKEYQGNDLLAKLVSYLLEYLKENNIYHIFLYSKPEIAYLFKKLGFEEIIRTEQVVFMELGKPDFTDYVTTLNYYKQAFSQISSIVMNANPFTLGHKHLIQRASEESEWVFVFVVTEDISEFSFDERLEMVQQGCSSFTNVTVLPTMNYQVSLATFPSYFLKDQAELEIAKEQAKLDAKLFKECIAKNLKIKCRYVGDEPYSKVTNVYNEAMKEEFGDEIDLIICPRLSVGSEIISATKVRKAYEKRDWHRIEKMVPESTYIYLLNKGE